jgi:hypothetical protein
MGDNYFTFFFVFFMGGRFFERLFIERHSQFLKVGASYPAQ